MRKALAGRVELQPDGDTLPIVRSHLDPLGASIQYHKGDLMKARWTGGPIGLYVDDAAKTPTLFYHAMQTFALNWVVGESVLVMMDFRFWQKLSSRRARRRFAVQQRLFERHSNCFEKIKDDTLAGSIAAFRYVAPLPMAAIRRQAQIRRALLHLPF